MSKEQWKVDLEKRQAAQAKAFKAMTDGQQQSLKETYKALQRALSMIHDTQDLYLSDVQRLESAFWSINHNFNCEQWKETD